MKILAVDLGDSRTGLAICDRREFLAKPLPIITAHRWPDITEKILAAAATEEADLIVVGYPKNMNGSVGERARKSEEFVEELKEATALPVVLWDERLTTVSALHYMNQNNVRGKERKELLDSAAACIILESYLAYRKNQLLEKDD